MDITEEIREEEAMSGKLKITGNKKGVIQQVQKNQRNLKEKKYQNHHWINLNPKDMKITSNFRVFLSLVL